MKRIVYYRKKDGFSISEHSLFQSIVEDAITFSSVLFVEWICKTFFNNGLIVEMLLGLLVLGLMVKYPRDEVRITREEAAKIICGIDNKK